MRLPRSRLRRADTPEKNKSLNDLDRVAEGSRLTFRAELMPGRDAAERTFTVARVLANTRVELIGLSGQHTLTEFEPVH
jgi:hypothetical protein